VLSEEDELELWQSGLHPSSQELQMQSLVGPPGQRMKPHWHGQLDEEEELEEEELELEDFLGRMYSQGLPQGFLRVVEEELELEEELERFLQGQAAVVEEEELGACM